MSNMLVNRRVLGISMDRQRNRRLLVAFLYLCVAVFYGLVFLGRVSGMAMFLTISVLINPLVFGEFLFWGKKRGGILKPFHPDPEQRNDERELAARDLAHFHAYGWVTLLILFIAIAPEYVPSKYLSGTHLFSLAQNLLWGLLALALTLPQAILLWSEPDVDVGPDVGSPQFDTPSVRSKG
jgi:hypothetical protein